MVEEKSGKGLRMAGKGWRTEPAPHRPLARIVQGPRVSIGPLTEPPQRLPPPPLDLQDSCYSSCSDSDHSSLSRNTSAASETLAGDSLAGALTSLSLQSPDYRTLLDFSLKLGFSESQLLLVLHKLGSFPPAQDRVLAELTALRPLQPSRGASPPHAPAPDPLPSLRPITIDGSNLAMTHGRKEVFSCGGIKECVEYFKRRGHNDIKVFVPQFRKEDSRPDSPITDQHILLELEREGVLVWTPSRRVGGRRIVCHDDRYILKTAVEKEAVVVSNDEFRDLVKENQDFRRVVEERLLMYSFVDGKFMPPDDPLGRHGPGLDQFLSKGGAPPSAPLCPYGRKCTYGNKCKFFHPERPGGIHVSVTDRLKGRKAQLQPRFSLRVEGREVERVSGKPLACRTQSLNPEAFPFPHHTPSPHRVAESGGVVGGGRGQLAPPLPHHSVSKQLSNPEQGPSSFSPHPEDPRHGYHQVPPQLWPWLRVVDAEHQTLSRNMSAPGVSLSPNPHLLAPRREGKESGEGEAGGWERKGSVSDSQLHLLKEEGPWTPSQGQDPQRNFFIPSSAVWGPMEFSVSPVHPPPDLPPPNEDSGFSPRHRLYYHLSSLFPEHAVKSVMAQHPQEMDPQILCSLILAAQSQDPPS